jgi:hypothetical protein
VPPVGLEGFDPGAPFVPDIPFGPITIVETPLVESPIKLIDPNVNELMFPKEVEIESAV